MGFYKSTRFWIVIVLVVGGLILLQQIWHWEVERIEVLPGKFLVKIHRWGRDLPETQIVAPDDSYKGIMLEPLMPGRHFLNPIFHSYEIHDMVQVPSNKCLVLIKKYGEDGPQTGLDARNILASDKERGIIADVRMPGSHAINPHAYEKMLVDAVEVRSDQVGVRTRKVGKDPRTLTAQERKSSYVVPEGYRGVQDRFVPPGIYYLNPFVETITPVEVRSHKVEFADIQFPSKDGFILKPHVVVEYAVLKDMAPEVLVRLTDEGALHQEDSTPEQQTRNEILQKVILPLVRGYARLEGSNFNATDFISVDTGASKLNGREDLQRILKEAVKPKCEKVGIAILAVTLAQMDLPPQLTEQISMREQALAEQMKNRERVEQYKSEQQLEAKKQLAQQAEEKVKAETRLQQAETKATQQKDIEKQKLQAELKIAQTKLEAAREQEKAILAQAQAEADVTTANNKAEVAALKKSIQGFGGAQNFAQYTMLSRIAPTLQEIFASDESEFARIFSAFMTPAPAANGRSSSAVPGPGVNPPAPK